MLLEPIVSPWIIYLIELLDSIKTLTGILIFMTVVISVLYGVVYAETALHHNKPIDITKYFKKVVIIIIILLCIHAIIPSKETAVSMMMAAFITPDNINLTEDHFMELITRIIEAGKSAIQK